jgi:MFS family permease
VANGGNVTDSKRALLEALKSVNIVVGLVVVGVSNVVVTFAILSVLWLAHVPYASPVAVVANTIAGVAISVLGGYVVGRLSRKAPLTSSIILGCLEAAASAARMLLAHAWSWTFLPYAAVIVAATAAGGYVASRRPRKPGSPEPEAD